MKRNVMSVCMLWVLVLLTSARAASGAQIVDGSLGEWLRRDAGPTLADMVDRHPRLHGETLRIVAMDGGRIVSIDDRLTDDIRRQLTHVLLAASGARLMTSGRESCVTDLVAHHVVGIEVDARTKPHRVTLAIVDVEEGVWVNGSHRVWTGSLDSIQVREHRRRVELPDSDSHFRLSDAASIAAAIHDQMRCAPRLAAPLFIAVDDEPALADIERELRREIGRDRAGQMTVTSEQSRARTVLTLRIAEDRLTLSRGQDNAQSLIAAVNLLRGQTPMAVTGSRPVALPKSPALLSPIELAPDDSRGRCERADPDCVEVGLDLYQSAYTLLFYTSAQRLVVGCERPERVRAGRLHYGLNVPSPRDGARPELGFYVLAVPERELAWKIHDALTASSASCRPGGGDFGSLSQLLRETRDVTDWQQIHLAREGRRVREYIEGDD